MKRLLLLLLGCGITLNVAAQSAIVKGTILDRINFEPLAGAHVLIDSTYSGSAADLEGRYSFNLPAGEHVLTFKFIGYEDLEERITLAPGETKVLNVGMISDIQQLSSVTITGNLQGQAKALNQQRTADNIKNVVAADQIGRFPDPNAAEALQRVSGVNIERDQGEGRYVFVRGLAPQFTNININGEQIPSPEADVRYVALDAIPSDQLASMEVTKSLTPDMDGDAIGGSVNLVTRTAESEKPRIRGSVLGGYNNLMGKVNAQGSISYAQRFADKKLGVLLNTSYYSNNLGSDNWEREPFDNELELRDYELTRTRTGLSSTIDYRFDENNEIYVRGLYTRFTDREWRRRYVFAPEDEEIAKSVKDRFEAQSVSTINVGAKHNYPNIQVDYEAQYSYGEQRTPYDHELTFIGGIPSTLGFDGANFPTLSAPGYLDNSEYDFDEFETGNTLAKDQNITAKLNIGIPYKKGANAGLLKFGGKVRFKEKSYDIVNNKYQELGGVPGLSNFEGGLLDENYLGGEYQLSAFQHTPNFIRYFNANPSQFELQAEDKAIDEAVEAFTATENVYAAYVMARQQVKKLTVLGGVRYERTEVEYNSSDVVIAPDGDLDEIIPQNGGTTYDFVLPQLHFKYALDYYTNLRAAATFSYARPNFAQIVPSQEANLEDNEATVGNAELLPVGAFNLDILGEHYFKSVGVLSGGVFYKRLDNFIYNNIMYNSQYPLNVANPIANGVDVTQAQNGETANIYGVEVAYQQQLAFLPSIWKNFNLYLNYTYTHSEATIQDRLNAEDNPEALETLRLPGQATNLGNAALAYETPKFSVRLAANFNGSYLSEIGGVPEEDEYVASRAQLDFTASYTVTPKIRAFAEVMNVTNQPFERYIGSEDIVTQREYYGFWARLGVKFDL